MNDMNVLIKTTKGFAKKELQKVLKKSESHVQDLQNHIKEGTQVLTQKKSELGKLEDEEKAKEPPAPVAAPKPAKPAAEVQNKQSLM